MKNLDSFLYEIPLVGIVMKRNYAYFKQNTAITNSIHIILGIGIGLIFSTDTLFIIGIALIIAGVLGHVYAFVKGGAN